MMSDLQLEVFCGGIFQTNGYLVTTRREVVGLRRARGHHRLARGKRRERPEALILTHQHHDHVLDVGRIQSAFGCPVYAHSEPSEELTLSKRLERMMGIPCEIDPYTVDHRFDGLDSIDLGGLVPRPLSTCRAIRRTASVSSCAACPS
jgi:glyoxylase-like metal-dependent hydrolase (beta-lactamase superfamily II)